MYLPAVIVAALALIFTVTSFWWLNARTGDLVSYSVTTFAGSIHVDSLVIQLPVVIHNTGAKTRVVRALRLQGMDQSKSLFHLAAQKFETKLESENDGSDFVHAFAIEGRSVITKYIRFSTMETPLLKPGEPIPLVLEGLIDESDIWKGLKTVYINIGTLGASFTTMSNIPDYWQSSALADGRKHQEAVMEYVLERRKRLSV
jgi:hypothetical protein